MSVIVLIFSALVLFVAWLAKAFYGYLLVMNLLAFTIVAFDKLKSVNQWYRIRENDMFILFLFGGWLGGIFSMMFFRHKTRKESFLAMTTCASALSIFFTMKAGGFLS